MNEPTSSGKSPVIRVFDCFIVKRGPEPDVGAVRPASTDDEPRYLLLRRAGHKIYSGDWRMVGGKIRANETAWQACLREVDEETRLPIEQLWAVPYVNRFYEWRRDRINDIPVFLAITNSTTPELDDEHDAFEWLPLDEACSRLVWPAQREGLRAADRFFRDPGALLEHCRVEIA